MQHEFWNRRVTVVAIWGALIVGADYCFRSSPVRTVSFPDVRSASSLVSLALAAEVRARCINFFMATYRPPSC